MIECSQFNEPIFQKPHFDINDGEKHYIIYNHKSEGFLFSKPKNLKVNRASDNIERKFIEINDRDEQGVERIIKWCETDAFKIYRDMAYRNGAFTISSAASYLLNQYNIVWIPILY
jgi:hypothetical protein